MRICRCSFRSFFSCLKFGKLPFGRRCLLIHQTFFHNADDSIDLRIDTILQPLFVLTDTLARYLGRLFICFFILIISCAIYVFYTTIFVHLYEEIPSTRNSQGQHSIWTFFLHIFVGHWLLINIMFNYFQCVRVDPGSSPYFGYSKPYDFDKTDRDRMKIYQSMIDKNNNTKKKSDSITIVDLNVEQISSSSDKTFTIPIVRPSNVCRKCIYPKPTRAHHCSICAKCILNQDHHCPWINNCVGHLNHRYFFQFCFFLTLGSTYAATFGFTEFQHFLFGRKEFSYFDLISSQKLNSVEIRAEVSNAPTYFTFLFLFIVALTASVVLLGFTFWHFWLISHAETTIDFHTNSVERKRLKKLGEKFVNPYHLGFRLNWKMFLSVNKWYEIFYRNLLPSTHRPFCDGINWPRRNFDDENPQKTKSTLIEV